MSDTVVIRCRDCGALFYASQRIEPADVLEIIRYKEQGHKIAVVDAAVVRIEFQSCTCERIK